MDGSEARVATMSEYDVQMASTGSASEAPGDYSKRMRDKKIMLAQYPGPDAKRFYSWTNGPLAKHLANKSSVLLEGLLKSSPRIADLRPRRRCTSP